MKRSRQKLESAQDYNMQKMRSSLPMSGNAKLIAAKKRNTQVTVVVDSIIDIILVNRK